MEAPATVTLSEYEKQHLQGFVQQAANAHTNLVNVRAQAARAVADTEAQLHLAQSNLHAACALISGPRRHVDISTMTIMRDEVPAAP